MNNLVTEVVDSLVRELKEWVNQFSIKSITEIRLDKEEILAINTDLELQDFISTTTISNLEVSRERYMDRVILEIMDKVVELNPDLDLEQFKRKFSESLLSKHETITRMMDDRLFKLVRTIQKDVELKVLIEKIVKEELFKKSLSFYLKDNHTFKAELLFCLKCLHNIKHEMGELIMFILIRNTLKAIQNEDSTFLSLKSFLLGDKKRFI